MIALLRKLHPNKLYPVLFTLLIENREKNRQSNIMVWIIQAIIQLNDLLPHYLEDLNPEIIMKQINDYVSTYRQHSNIKSDIVSKVFNRVMKKLAKYYKDSLLQYCHDNFLKTWVKKLITTQSKCVLRSKKERIRETIKNIQSKRDIEVNIKQFYKLSRKFSSKIHFC